MFIQGEDANKNKEIIAMANVFKQIINSPLVRGRLMDNLSIAVHITNSSNTAVPVSQSGTWNLGNFPYNQLIEIIQRSNIEYNDVQRSKFTF